MLNQTKSLFLGGLILLLTGCVLKPDLIAVRQTDLGLDPIAYCKLENNKLVITVKNEGAGDAPASVTKITFTSVPGGSIVRNLNTPALAAGALHAHEPLDFPESCFQPDCHFDIKIDSTNLLDESNEGNNSARGYCLG